MDRPTHGPRRLSPGTAAAALVVALAAGGVAYAEIPDSDGTITGCYRLSGGTLRIIDAAGGQTCGKNETQLTFNQSGPPGPEGPEGHRARHPRPFRCG